MASSGTTSNKNDITEEDRVTVSVAYNGTWIYEGKEWFFKNSRSSTIVVPKHVTLSEITDILYKQFEVNKKLYRLILEVRYRTETFWTPATQIQNDQDLSEFIAATSKRKLPLCVSLYDDEISSDVDEERRKDHVRVLVAYNGKWRWDGEKWLFENSKGLVMDVSKYITLSLITDILCKKFEVDQDSYDLKLEVHYTSGSPWFPIIKIKDDQDLSVFISESWKTKLPLCVTRVAKDVVVERAEHEREDDRVGKRLMKAIQEGDWVKAREIINTGEVTWTFKLDDDGNTAFHFAVGQYKNNEVVRDILRGINRELLVTTVNNHGLTPVHTAATFGNTEALKRMWHSNPRCLINPNDDHLPIYYALVVPAINTFLFLFEQMKHNKVEYDMLVRGRSGLNLLHRVIDTGLIDVAYELINDYPNLATTVYKGKTALECIITKPELFYSGTSYSFYSRFVYRIVPIEYNSLGSNDTEDVENQVSPKKDKFVIKYTRRCLHYVISKICVKLWETTLLHVPHVKHLKDDKVKHNTTVKLLWRICEEVERTNSSSDNERLYSSLFFLALENNTAEAIDVMTTYFKELYGSAKDGHNIFQLAVLNRSEKVYSFIMNHKRYVKTIFLASEDDDRNNILHLAGRLAPLHKLNAASGAALQMQRELQWFELNYRK